jgi:hypothetical protein
MINFTTIRAKATQAAVAASLAVAAPVAALAATPGELINQNAGRTASAAGFNQAKKLPELVGSFIQQAMGLLGIILVCLVIYAGFLWMTAQGNDEKIKKAKGIISSAVVGLVLIFAAYAITGFVVDALVNATGS